MPLKKPSHPAVIFNNFIYRTANATVFKVKTPATNDEESSYNIPLLITDSVYEVDKTGAGFPASINLGDYSLVEMDEISVVRTQGKTPIKAFPTKFSDAGDNLKYDDAAPEYYNPEHAVLMLKEEADNWNKPGWIDGPFWSELSQAADPTTAFLPYQTRLFDNLRKKLKYKALPAGPWSGLLLYQILRAKQKLSGAPALPGFLISHLSKNDFTSYTLSMHPKSFAIIDHLFDNALQSSPVDTTSKMLGRFFKYPMSKASNPPSPQFRPGKYEFQFVGGIFTSAARFLSLMLVPDKTYGFRFNNFALNDDKNDSILSVVAPVSFFAKYFELKKEPEVPENANENNIVSFYQHVLNHPKKFNEETFLYQGGKFSPYETEVLAASTLIEKSSTHQDFVKPYSSVRFYANFKTNKWLNKVNEINNTFTIPKLKYMYLKRFVENKKSLNTNAPLTLLFSNGANLVDLYTADISDGITLKGASYDKKFPNGSWSHDVNVNAKARITDFEKVREGELSPFEVVGYLITKSTKKKGSSGYDDSIIKRIYIMNDKPEFAGYLGYFDSQIKEKEAYYYNIEQINLVYGTHFQFKSPAEKVINMRSPKKFFKGPGAASAHYASILNKHLTAADAEKNTKKWNKSLPFYHKPPIAENDILPAAKINLALGVAKADIVVHTPVKTGPDELVSPDLELETKTVKVPPMPPDIQIYTQQGVTNKATVVLSAIVGNVTSNVEMHQVGLQKGTTKTNVVVLGSFEAVLNIPLKEYRIYRTTEKPESYESFSNIPHKVIDPQYPDFTDDVLPNVDYYYCAKSVGPGGVESSPTKILKLVIINEQSHVYSLLEVFNFGE